MPDTHIEKPVCLAVIVCEKVIHNAKTNSKSYIECFDTVAAQSVPVAARNLTIAASVTNVVGTADIVLRVTSPSGSEALKVEGAVQAPDPLSTVDMVFELQNLKLPEFGMYHIDVLAGTEHVGGRRFRVVNPQARTNR